MKTPIVVGVLLASLSFAAFAMDNHGVRPSSMKWTAAPPFFMPGMKIAVISGDPGKEGPYVLRASMPAGYKIAPHTHPTDENVTVLSGTMHIGTGAKFDKEKGEPMEAGAFIRVGKGMQHYVWTTTATVIQVHGLGPFAITYVNPADDPRGATTVKK